MTEELKVYAAIAAVADELSHTGIAKSRDNQQQRYKFRGIDDVYNALAPIIAKHKLCILPRVVDRVVAERETRNGGVLFYTTLTVEYDFVSAEDGSRHVIRTIGEAMDSGDKSSNKAMSAAYKYACMQAFCIPTEGDNDADATTHDGIKPKSEKQKPEKAPSKDEATRNLYKRLETVIRAKKTLEALLEWGNDADNQADISKLPKDWQDSIRFEFKAKRADLKKSSSDDDGFPGSNDDFNGIAAE